MGQLLNLNFAITVFGCFPTQVAVESEGYIHRNLLSYERLKMWYSI